ncbi:hypothetical protein HG530_008594 [Fusarium avenaceum]|nr:hypothetical protein HG530_008594 [Fusarium avenaceum]
MQNQHRWNHRLARSTSMLHRAENFPQCTSLCHDETFYVTYTCSCDASVEAPSQTVETVSYAADVGYQPALTPAANDEFLGIRKAFFDGVVGDGYDIGIVVFSLSAHADCLAGFWIHGDIPYPEFFALFEDILTTQLADDIDKPNGSVHQQFAAYNDKVCGIIVHATGNFGKVIWLVYDCAQLIDLTVLNVDGGYSHAGQEGLFDVRIFSGEKGQRFPVWAPCDFTDVLIAFDKDLGFVTFHIDESQPRVFPSLTPNFRIRLLLLLFILAVLTLLIRRDICNRLSSR